MRINEIREGEWRLVVDGNEKLFNTEREALIVASKIKYIEELRGVATSLSSVADKAQDLFEVYFDRGYNGEDGITEDDLEQLDITTSDLVGMITLAEQLSNLLHGRAITAADYDSTLNKMRTDV